MTADIVPGNPSVPLSFESGETLGGVLGDLGLEAAEAHQVVTELAKFADLRKLRPQDQYSATFGFENGLARFDLLLASRGRARVERGSDGWQGTWKAFERTVKISTVEGRLDSALEVAIQDAGGPPALSILMSDVFQWDLDFTRDLRQGDTFNVLYETVYLDGAYDSLGQILAITYDNSGRRLEAYLFGDDGQYFDPDGRPMRKMFLRSPLRYSRVTSRFTNRRFHPVLKRYRPHYGVDYGAPTGTPARVTANGTVVFAGWDRGGGKTVKVRHPNGYLTAYLHLSRYGPGVRSGRRVSQGDVIGYVGATGLVTGAHLDYRVQRNGRWIDPLSLRSVPADPVPTERLPEFMAWRDRLRESLFEGAPPPSEIEFPSTQLAEKPTVETPTTAVGGAR
jgi:murein DD-endopeptidase MepM/ murein hydrolase activator NlpD